MNEDELEEMDGDTPEDDLEGDFEDELDDDMPVTSDEEEHPEF